MKAEVLTAVAAVIVACTGLITAFGVIILGRLKQVHTLVNSQYGESLRIGMVSAKALAASDGTVENHKLADEAVLKWKDHMMKQAALDAEKTK